MTIRTFNREWNKYFNLSPNQYLITLRIESAKRLLSGAALPISQIAEHCGFCDVMYFTRCFKNKVGMPPGAYRKHAKSSSDF
jgi:AraC family transcriptional regulator